MLTVDPIVLDPKEFKPSGAELDLSGAGFRIVEADFGEADIELEMQRRAFGEAPTNWHPPNTQTVLKLVVREEGEVDLPAAAYKLAQKVGEFNEPGTEHWLRRDFKVGGEFAGSLGRQVFKAGLAGLGSWQRGESPDVVLTLATGPYWYATTEVESEEFSETSERELIWELSEVLGTAPGLIRIIVTNDNSSGDWRSLVSAIESRDHPQDSTADTTAALAYRCADLTPKGGAVEAEREGEKVVRHTGLNAGWLTILESKIAALGHMTHKGVRRMHLRIYDPGSEAGNVQLRLRWRALGTLQWDELNSIIPTPLVGDWSVVDLGEARLEMAAVGDQRWEWQVQARAISGSVGLDLARVWVYPTEQFAVARATYVAPAADLLSQRTPAVAEDNPDRGVAVWNTPSNALTQNSIYAKVELK